MNQAIRSRVYGKGNRHHVEFMVDLCGMNKTEAAVFRLLHDGRSDSYIEDTVGITKPTREYIRKHERIEDMLGVE